ncbi:hypothetical protein ACJX0J_034351, partial [Zea mays]
QCGNYGLSHHPLAHSLFDNMQTIIMSCDMPYFCNFYWTANCFRNFYLIRFIKMSEIFMYYIFFIIE